MLELFFVTLKPNRFFLEFLILTELVFRFSGFVYRVVMSLNKLKADSGSDLPNNLISSRRWPPKRFQLQNDSSFNQCDKTPSTFCSYTLFLRHANTFSDNRKE